MKIPSRKEIIQKAMSDHLKIAAVLPFHYPRALLRAHGIQPIEVWGPPHVDDMSGQQHFPEYTCKIVQKATRFLQTPSADCVDCMLIPHTCDSLQGMASVMRDHLNVGKPVFTLYPPRGRRNSDLNFLYAELKRLSASLSEVSGREPSEKVLIESIELEDKALYLYGKIVNNRSRYDVSDREFYTLIRSREYLPAETFIDLAQKLPKGRPTLMGPGILLSGIVPEPMELFDRINDYGAHVIADDLACGSRRAYENFSDVDPFMRLARQLMSMPPDSTISTPYNQRYDYLMDRMARFKAKGMLVYEVKFCEPELFYLPLLEERLKAKGYGFLYVETELTPEIPHTVLNRINAFIEVLS